MRLNLHLLRVFFEVAERRSFSRAAEALHISQPAVSKAVRELERLVDLPLIERGPRGTKGARLTDSGSALAEHARGIFALERAALDDVRARRSRQRGRLTLGASTTIAGYWLPAPLAALAKRHPDADLRVVVSNTDTVAAALIDCAVDLALVEGAVDDPRIVSTVWCDDPLRIVVPSGFPATRRRASATTALNAATWLMREPGSGTRMAAEAMLRALDIVPARTVELGSNEAIARAVAAGLGVAILPACVVRDLLRLGEVACLRHAGAERARPLFLLQLRERPMSPLATAFVEALAQPGKPRTPPRRGARH